MKKAVKRLIKALKQVKQVLDSSESKYAQEAVKICNKAIKKG